MRQASAAPLLPDLKAWLNTTVRREGSRKPDLTGAIRYTLSLWPELTRYADDGRIEIGDNTAERALRTVALGRKNCLFAGSDAGGERAAAFYSLIGTTKLCNMDQLAYLREVFTDVADYPINRIAEPLPWNLRTASATPIKVAA